MSDRVPLSPTNLATEAGAFKSRDTIAAISTAPGRAAIAVLRVSGPAAGAALAAICGLLPEPRRAVFRAFRDPVDGSLVDRGLALWFPGPGSATGEDLAELHSHGGRAVTAALLRSALCIEGVRLAEPGEFTRRAFVAGRMDLTEAEGLADLLAAETDAQRRQALLHSDGALSAAVDRWRDRLIGAMALLEAGIDFSDEDGVPETVRAEAKRDVEGLVEDLGRALADRRAERLRDGFQVAILGRPNAGKSSLLNALARRDVAIVTEAAGTTRDVIEVHLDLNGVPATIADTAGLRDAQDLAEREGVVRARARAASADLALWLEDATSPAEPPPFKATAVWRVSTKIDLHPAAEMADHAVSARSGVGLPELIAALGDAARDATGTGESVGLTRERHRDGISAAASALRSALAEWDTCPEELLAESLRAAATELGRVTGRIGVEDVLGRVFSSFCIGK